MRRVTGARGMSRSKRLLATILFGWTVNWGCFCTFIILFISYGAHAT